MAVKPALAPISVYTLPPSPPNWDRVGVFYISFCATWTALLLAGMAVCVFYRRSPIIRVRCLPLSFSAIALLHVYWILGQITYPIGKTMNLVLAYDIQYFFMGIYYPLGIALFQASNLRFLHVAKMQKQFAHPEIRRQRGCDGAHSSWLCRLKNMNYTKKILLFISIGMVAQVILTIGMWFARKKYHPTYGIPGTGLRGATIPEQVANLGRGWEWWPTLVWQFTWAWIVAPTLLWRAWGIRDTMGWRTQTIACCISSLHSTPMFLVASYVPAFEKVNMYFTQSQWIHVSIMMWEIFTVFVPIYEVIRLQILSKKAADSNAIFELTSLSTRLGTPYSVETKNTSSPTLAEKAQGLESLRECMGDRLFTVDALEHVLRENPNPLQEFSALSDFSGENIAFLTRTAAWKSSFPKTLNDDQTLDAFNHALWLYTTFVSPRDAEFPLNLSSHDLKPLEAIFEKPARTVCGEGSVNPATPFDFDFPVQPSYDIGLQTRYTGEIPSGFDMAVFDVVEDHVKYLVLTNTWPKYVEAMRRRSTDTAGSHSDLSATSEATLGSWLSSQSVKIKSFF